MNIKVDECDGKAVGMVNGQDQQVWQVSSNEFWKIIGCLVSDPIVGCGGLSMWEKEEAQKIIGKKWKRISISIKVDSYEVCISYTIYCLIFIL